MSEKTLSIGELARRANVATSLLRYYEKEGLLKPSSRTAAGYRLYAADAERTLRFIRSAQRHGFSLNDIRLILGSGESRGRPDSAIMDMAEQRFLEIERRVTEMLVQRHELELFLDDVAEQIDRSAGRSQGQQYRELLERVCGHDPANKRPSSLRKLVQRLGCNLATAEWESLFADLRGQHIHIWRDEDGYSVLFSSANKKVRKALGKLAAGELDCDAHLQPQVDTSEGGTLFRAHGPNAFLFAQLFLALEALEA